MEKGNRAVIEAFMAQNPLLLQLVMLGEIKISQEYAESMITLNTEICNEVFKAEKEIGGGDPF